MTTYWPLYALIVIEGNNETFLKRNREERKKYASHLNSSNHSHRIERAQHIEQRTSKHTSLNMFVNVHCSFFHFRRWPKVFQSRKWLQDLVMVVCHWVWNSFDFWLYFSIWHSLLLEYFYWRLVFMLFEIQNYNNFDHYSILMCNQHIHKVSPISKCLLLPLLLLAEFC